MNLVMISEQTNLTHIFDFFETHTYNFLQKKSNAMDNFKKSYSELKTHLD
jgi:hypothetical protein